MASMKILRSVSAASAASAVLFAGTWTLTPAAHAEPPSVGSTCDSSQLNLTTESSAGEGLRCLADNTKGYIWKDDPGSPQDREDAERIARNACHQLRHGTHECTSVLDQLPHH